LAKTIYKSLVKAVNMDSVGGRAVPLANKTNVNVGRYSLMIPIRMGKSHYLVRFSVLRMVAHRYT
jgi:hypothetical protein